MADAIDIMKEVVRTVLREEIKIEIEHDLDTIPGGEQEITTKVYIMLNGDVIHEAEASEIIGHEEY
jgi:ABC-type branched-subunit amino acid transport system ATPase component